MEWRGSVLDDHRPAIIVFYEFMDQRVSNLVYAFDAIYGLMNVGDELVAVLDQCNGHDVAAPEHRGDIADLRLSRERRRDPRYVGAMFDVDPQQRHQWLGEAIDIGDGGDTNDLFVEQPLDAGPDGTFGHAELARDRAIADSRVLRQPIDDLAIEYVEFESFHARSPARWK